MVLTEIEKKGRIENIPSLKKSYRLGQSIYHYTTAHALYGILKNQELWLGSTASMNDKKEVIFFVEQLEEALLADLEEEKQQVACRTYFENVKNRLKQEYPFALCLTRLYDNAAQWDRYADWGKGVCIALNTEKFLTLMYYSDGAISPVFYDYDVRNHDHYRILKKYFTTGNLSDFKEKGQIDNMLLCGYFHKHESFCTEEEIRLSTMWGHILSCSYKDFEVINGKIKSILKLNLKEVCKKEVDGIERMGEEEKVKEINLVFQSLIDQILIGPRSEQNEEELKSFLEACGYDILAKKIKKSDCPLR